MALNGCACVPPDNEDWSQEWIRECDYHAAMRLENERLRAALCYVADNTMETHTLYRALTALRGGEE